MCPEMSVILANLILRYVSLRANSTDFVKRSELPPQVDPAHQQRKACPKSRVVPRLKESNLIGGKRPLLFSFTKVDR